MKKINYCIMCEMEGKKRHGIYIIRENTVDGKAYVCKTHYDEWNALEELILNTNGNNITEDFND